MAAQPLSCPCGAGDYAACCGRYHNGIPAPDAGSLMRSRYSAYVLKLEPYLLASWHTSTRPATPRLISRLTTRNGSLSKSKSNLANQPIMPQWNSLPATRLAVEQGGCTRSADLCARMESGSTWMGNLLTQPEIKILCGSIPHHERVSRFNKSWPANAVPAIHVPEINVWRFAVASRYRLRKRQNDADRDNP